MKTWRQCFFEPRSLVSDKWDGYFEVYDRCFERYRSRAHPVYLEIGCLGGGSLETARNYFGPSAKIYGIDVDPACAALSGKYGIDRVFIGDQADPQFMAETLTTIGAPDIILDDGSHRPADMIASFELTFPRLADHGLYLIEDTCCDFYATHRHPSEETSAGYFAKLAAELPLNMSDPRLIETRFRLPLSGRDGEVQNRSEIAREVYAISFFESIVAIEKRTHQPEPLRQVR